MRTAAVIRQALLVLFALFGSASVQAEDYPTKPIRILVGFGAGGGTDFVARLLSASLSQRLGQPVVVENRTGASGTIAAAYVAKQPADGYTLLMGTVSSHAMAPSVIKDLAYDPQKDFTPIALTLTVPHVVSVHPSVKASTLRELIDLAKVNPMGLSYPSAGVGSSPHFAGEIFQMETGTRLSHVPYKGSGPGIPDLLSGRLQVAFDTVPVIIKYVQAGQLRPLAICSSRRSPLLPNVPTVAEAGSPGCDITTWYGLFAPRGTPSAIVRKLHAEVNAAMQEPDIRAKLTANGDDGTVTSTPEEFARLLDADIKKYARVAKEANVVAD